MINLRIGVRLGVGFGVVVLLLIGVTFLGITRMATLNEGTNQIVKDSYPKVLLAQEVLNANNQVARSVRNVMLATDPALIAKEQGVILEKRKEIGETLGKIEKLLNTDKGKELFKAITEARPPYIAVLDETIKLHTDGKKQESVALLLGKTREAQFALTAKIQEFIKLLSGQVEANGKHAEETYQAARTLMLALAGLAVLLAIMIVWWVTRSVTGPIREAVGVAEALAKGDLSQKIEAKSKDETGQLLTALGNTVTQLKGIMGGIKESTETISTASSQIAQGNADLSQRTEEQASSLEETASSMEELTSTVKQNAENAKQANQLAAGASDVAVKGGAVVKQVVDTMSAVSESSKKIADIIGVIDGIAFQTNILALNAAVEAARAGEQGRGFAVVASEVRNLAQRSAAAAKEIKALIGDSVEKVGTGTKLVDEAGQTMQEIVSSVKRVTDIMTEIAAASQEQSSGIEQVNQAVTQMDEVTQQNAALVEEAAAAAESMQEQAQSLAQSVSVFKLDHEAAGGMARAAEKREKPAPATAPERRAPNRPTNVARLSAKAEKQTAAAASNPVASAPRGKKVAGGEDEWAEF